MEWRIGGMKQGKDASLIIEQEILNPKSEWKDKGEKKEFSWLKSYMQENLWFLTLWRTLQLPGYRLHRE